MSKKYRNVMVVLCLSAFVSLFAGVAAAETVYTCDFEELDAGQPLIGQDNWENIVGSGTFYVYDSNDTGSTLWDGNYVAKNSTSRSQDTQYNNLWSSMLVDNQDFDASALVKVYGGYTGTSEFSLAGLQQRYIVNANKKNWLLFGAQGQNIYWDFCPGDTSNRQIVTMEHGLTEGTAVYLVGFKGTAIGSGVYSMQPYYQDITGAGEKTDFGSPLSLTTSNLAGLWDSLQLRLNGSGEVGEIRISSGQVPEPSTLALLACGLVGLLAYAWKKRK